MSDTSDMEQDVQEQAYIRGSQMAWIRMLRQCVRELGYEATEETHARWVIERTEIIQKLREFCEEYGDNDWPDDMHLADVIEKHLMRHIESEDA